MMDYITAGLVAVLALLIAIAYKSFRLYVKVREIEIKIECSRETKGVSSSEMTKEPTKVDSTGKNR